MTAKISCTVHDGLMPNEKIAEIETADGGRESVTVSPNNVHGSMLMAALIGRSEGRVLIELPRESMSGRWRIWVKEAALGA